MITGIELPRLRNAEFIQLMNDFLKMVQQNDAAALNVQLQYDKLQQDVSAAEALYKLEQGNALTEEITSKDARRDKAVNGIAAAAAAFTYHFDTAIARHAELLSRAIKQYGSGIARENYQAETAIIDNLLVDFDSKPGLADAINALGLKDWKNELHTANDDFNATYLLRTQQLGSVSKDTLQGQRQVTYISYYKLRDFLNSFYVINSGANPYGKTCNELNALLEQYNTMLAGRAAKEEPVLPEAPAA